MSNLEYKISYRRHLPHIQTPGATLFVTFRLVGSIPPHVQQRLLEEAEQVDKMLTQIADRSERARRAYEEHRRMFGKWDHALDTTVDGPHWLREPQIAGLVADSLHYRDNRVYELDCFCIMSNHAHVVFTPLQKEDKSYHALSAIMHSLKLYTALRANKMLNRRGQFWQHESYDHVVRNEAELQRIRRYVLNNPVKAGLVRAWDEWPWTYCKYVTG